jgi:hypothetical protein
MYVLSWVVTVKMMINGLFPKRIHLAVLVLEYFTH